MKQSGISFIAYFLTFSAMICGTIYLPTFPELEGVFQVSSTFIKFSITIYFIGTIIGSLLAGPLADTYGRKKILTIFLIFFCCATLICALAPTISWFLMGRFFQGIFEVASIVVSAALVADKFEGASYHKISSYLLVIFGLSPGIAPILGSLILQVFEWRFIFYFLFLLGIIGIFLAQQTTEQPHLEERKISTTLHEFSLLMKKPIFLNYWSIICVFYGAYYSFIVLSPYLFRLHYHWSIMEFAWVGVTLAAGNGIGAFLNKILLDRIGDHGVSVVGLSLTALSLLLLFTFSLPSQGLWVLLMFLLFIVGENLVSACVATLGVKLDPQFTGIAASLINLARGLGVSLALILILGLPETIWTVNFILLAAFTICLYNYYKIRKAT